MTTKNIIALTVNVGSNKNFKRNSDEVVVFFVNHRCLMEPHFKLFKIVTTACIQYWACLILNQRLDWPKCHLYSFGSFRICHGSSKKFGQLSEVLFQPFLIFLQHVLSIKILTFCTENFFNSKNVVQSNSRLKMLFCI